MGLIRSFALLRGLVLLPGLLFAALALGCGASEESSVAVRPISEILEGPIEITDLTARSAAVRATTSVDVVCSVVYGPDNTFGHQSTDLNMAGGGHREHAAPLRGLEPDTTYHYRLQGAGPDGTIYVSDVLTFRTPVEEPVSGDQRGNLASRSAGAKVVEVSSVFADSPSWQAENAVDGDPSTAWSSDGDGDDAFITVRLAEPHRLQAVGLWTRTMGATAQIFRFQVVADDGIVLGPFDLPDSAGLHQFPVNLVSQSLRFEVVTSSGGNTGIVELVAFGEQ
jgi:hypothetical protein